MREICADVITQTVKRLCIDANCHLSGDMKACIEDFYAAMRENRPYQNNIDSVRDTMALMLRMYDPYRGSTVD